MSELRRLIQLPRIWDRMDRLEARLLEASQSEDRYLTEIAQHLLVAGGKRYRPLLALLAAEFGPVQDGKSIEAGVAVELIHVGSLYHDDVIDEADTRRGASSANVNWTNTLAILAGDFLMAKASENAATHLSQESVRLLATTYAELVEGQTRELQIDFDISHGIADYERVIYLKTASLIRTSARLGAIASSADEGTIEALSTWAAEVGMVFQIADDALDLVATTERLGKPAGSDIREGKFTLPVLLALNGPDKESLESLLGERPYTDESIARVIALVRNGGFVEESLQQARARINAADAALAPLPDSEARAVLSAMGDFLVSRVDRAGNA